MLKKAIFRDTSNTLVNIKWKNANFWTKINRKLQYIRLVLELTLTPVTNLVILHCVCWGVHEFWGISEESYQKSIKFLNRLKSWNVLRMGR